MRVGLHITLSFFVLLVATDYSRAQLKSYEFEQIDSLQSLEERTVVIFIHTDWCKFCQAMKSSTFRDDQLTERLNEDFYFVRFNSEHKEDITFFGHTFSYEPTGENTGIHELAKELGTIDGKLTFPVTCLLNPEYEIIFQYNQFLSAGDYMKLLDELEK